MRSHVVTVALALGPLAGETTRTLGSFHDGESPPADATQTMDNIFKTQTTDHFTIRFDTSEETIRPLAIALEETYSGIERFCAAYGIGGRWQGTRLDILVFDKLEGFRQHLADIGFYGHSVAGLYDQRSNVAAFLNIAENPEIRRIDSGITLLRAQLRRDQHGKHIGTGAEGISKLRAARDSLVMDFNKFVVRHETAHQVLFNIGVHVRGAPCPSWVTEGLACQFETPQHEPDHVLGAINSGRLKDFREALGLDATAGTLDESAIANAIASGRFLSVPELIGHRDPLDGEAANAPFRYAQSWALVFYLARAHRHKFSRYLRHVSERKPGEEIDADGELRAFTLYVGEPNSEFRRAWIEYILGLHPTRAASDD